MRSSRLLLPCLVVCQIGVSGCPTRENLGASSLTVLGPGVVNDPRNKSLRFDILKFGLDRFCEEMTRRGVALKLADDQPVLGRFFADHCTSQVLDDDKRKSFVVQYSGKGFAWTNLSRRVGFKAAGLIEYAPDFQLNDEAMYVYFRPSRIDATSFETLMIESGMAQAGVALSGVNADEIGQSIVKGQLQRGFTVIRYDADGATDFGLGYIPKGQRPFQPFEVQHSTKLVLANDRTEVHSGQQDFIGSFQVTEEDQALYLNVTLDGAPAVDAVVVPKGTVDLMLDQYLTTPGPARLTAPPLLEERISAGQPWKRYLRLPKGSYFLIIDNSPAVGQTSPSAVGGDDRAAKLDYLVQLGEAP